VLQKKYANNCLVIISGMIVVFFLLLSIEEKLFLSGRDSIKKDSVTNAGPHGDDGSTTLSISSDRRSVAFGSIVSWGLPDDIFFQYVGCQVAFDGAYYIEYFPHFFINRIPHPLLIHATNRVCTSPPFYRHRVRGSLILFLNSTGVVGG
jgi:hypothetical protein